MLTPMILEDVRILFVKAQSKGDDRTLDMFSDLLTDKEVQHKGYTDKLGHYHAPHQQRHKVRTESAKPQDKLSAEYAAALATHNAAFAKFHAVRTAYHNRQVGDAEFIAARKEYDEATKVFDTAFARESMPKTPSAQQKPQAKVQEKPQVKSPVQEQPRGPTADAQTSAGERSIPPRLTGAAVRRLMRLNGHTVASLAATMHVTQARVREVRDSGVTNPLDVWGWLEFLEKQAPHQDQAKAVEKPQAKPTATEPAKQAVPAGLRYDPSVNRYNGRSLTRGDILVDAKGQRYTLDRANGFMLTLDRQSDRVRINASVDPFDKTRFMDLTHTGQNAYGSTEAKPQAKDAVAPAQEESTADTGPKEGDTKTENGVTYVLRDGRWHRQTPEEPAENAAITTLRAKIEELGGKAMLAPMLRKMSGSAKANKLIDSLASSTHMTRDQVLAEFGLKEVASKPAAASKPKAAATSNPSAHVDDLDPSSPNYRYRDTGYVAGSRKEEAANLLRMAKRGRQQVRATAVDWEELEKNPREAKEVITKSHLFGAVDWDALKAGGMEPGAGFLVDRIYAAVGTAPKDDTPQARKDYALGLESLRDRLEGCKTPDQVTKVLDEVRQEWEGTTLNAEESKKYAELTLQHQQALRPQQEYEKENRRLLGEASLKLNILDKVKYAKQRGPEWAADVKAAEAENEKAWAAAAKYRDDNPQFQGKHRDLGGGWSSYDSDVEWEARQIRNARELIVTGAKLRNAVENPLHRAWNQLGDRFLAVLNNRSSKGSETFRKQVVTAKAGRITDWSWAEKAEKTVTAPKEANEESVRFQLLVADKYERTGGRTVAVDSTEALKKTFGLREVQSGNWVLRDLNSARFHVERTAEAFADLADLIGAGDQQVAMNGRLALAFGARGKGNVGFGGAPRAHYEAVHRIINLTKMGGGGSLAHEWFHAFDNLLQEAFGKDASKDTYLTEDPSQLPHGELRDAFVGLRVALTKGPHRLARNVIYTATDVRTAQENIDRRDTELGQKVKYAGNVHAATYAVDDYFDGIIAKAPDHWRRNYEKRRQSWRQLAAAYYGANPAGGVISVESGPSMTSFAREAAKLDQEQVGKYWSQPKELAARAFQAWCEDRLQGQGRRNDYLSAKADNKHYLLGKPFPDGEERTRINAAFDRLMQVVAREDLLAKALGGRRIWLIKGRDWWGPPEQGGTDVQMTEAAVAEVHSGIIDPAKIGGSGLDKRLVPKILLLKARPKRRKRKIYMDAEEFQQEHERLVEVLRSPSHADDLAEARKQAQEVRDGH